MKFTLDQEKAIYEKDNNILVAAAAGSGKTAVLVERIIQKILNENIDIDKLLVVTFTNAAASEMREKILDAIYKKLDEDPENENLQRQINLLGKANISTIDSFCLDVIRNNFFEIDVSPNFRIASDEEITLLKQEILDDLFDEKYETKDENFLKLVTTYCEYKGDDKLKDLVLKLYEFSENAVYPEEWLNEKIEMFNCKCDLQEDFSKTAWGKILLDDLKESVISAEKNLRLVQNKLIKYKELDKYTDFLENEINMLKSFEVAISNSWDEAYNFYNDVYKTGSNWPKDKKIDLAIKDEAKNERAKIKKTLGDKLKKTLLYTSKDAYSDIFAMYDILKNLEDLVIEFSKKFALDKKEKNMMDFGDIEHFALEILVTKDENGNLVKTEIAKRYTEKFAEIAIDEYQDSNRVQETILQSISNGKNIFMVGDVKQSIYKFRRACPELFLEKYENYDLNGNDKGMKIKLFQNFRSRKSVLDFCNDVFESIMSKELGDIEYNENEFLNLGAEYDENEYMNKSEVYVIDDNEDDLEEAEEESVDEEIKWLSREEKESKFVAKKIDEIINSEVLITDKKNGKRKVQYKDIVILLRSTKMADIYEKELLKNNIPVFMDGGADFLDTVEITTMINLLKILDNPLDDIALVSALRSELFGFTDNELIDIRVLDKNISFFENINLAIEKSDDEKLKNKLVDFKDKTEKWRKESKYMPLSELIWEIYVETGFYNYSALMPNGSIRQANLKMLFLRAKEYEKTSFKGLFNFIRFIEKLKVGSTDLSSAKVIGENENVVRIMSIHKSKGLEFPIVFLCNSSKRINIQDTQGDLILHQDVGLGPEYINYERKIKFPTAAKKAIAISLKEETLSEEMRVLYVALTRAKEKLIVTGVRGKEAENLERKREGLEEYIKNKKINPIIVKNVKSYLDWIELTHLRNEILYGKNNTFDFNIISQKDLIKKVDDEQEENQKFDFSEYDNFGEIKEKFDWEYCDKLKTELPIKTTVSRIKELENETVDFENLNKKEVGLDEVKPEFMKSINITPSQRGTANHLVLEKIDFNKIDSKDDILEFMQELIAKNFLTEEESKSVDIQRIWNFGNSYIGQKLKKSKKVYKEEPFYMKINASKIYNNAKDEELLIQGIIDLFFEDENGDIVLVDYKTDYVNSGEENILVDKYKTQLMLYKQAIEEMTGRDVSESYIYSLCLNKAVKI